VAAFSLSAIGLFPVFGQKPAIRPGAWFIYTPIYLMRIVVALTKTATMTMVSEIAS
jgi:hypothetical protein